jgi:transposase
MGLGTVHEYLERALAAGIGWPLPEGVGEEELEVRLFGSQPVQARATPQRPQPDWKVVHEELQRHRHLTLQLVWEEYRQANPDGYRYSWFCDRYQQWRRHLDVMLRQEHKAGEKMFVDWARPRRSIARPHALGFTLEWFVELPHWLESPRERSPSFLGVAPDSMPPESVQNFQRLQ